MSAQPVNIGSVERIARVGFGALLGVAGVVLSVMPARSSVARRWLPRAVAVGFHLVVTGATGYSPLYARLRREPRALSAAEA